MLLSCLRPFRLGCDHWLRQRLQQASEGEQQRQGAHWPLWRSAATRVPMAHRFRGACALAVFVLLPVDAFAFADGLHFRLCTESQPALPLSNPDPDKPGPAQRLIAETARRAQMRIEHIQALWEECQNLLRLGQVDATNVTGYAGVNIEIGAFPMRGAQPDTQRALGVIPTYLYRRVGSPADFVSGRFHLVKTAVGVLAGYQVNSIAVAQAGGMPDDSSQTVDALARRLAAGRLDMVAADESMQLLIDGQFSGKLERLSAPLRMDHYYVAFGKIFYQRNRDAVERFWTVLGQVRKETQPVHSR